MYDYIIVRKKPTSLPLSYSHYVSVIIHLSGKFSFFAPCTVLLFLDVIPGIENTMMPESHSISQHVKVYPCMMHTLVNTNFTFESARLRPVYAWHELCLRRGGIPAKHQSFLKHTVGAMRSAPHSHLNSHQSSHQREPWAVCPLTLLAHTWDLGRAEMIPNQIGREQHFLLVAAVEARFMRTETLQEQRNVFIFQSFGLFFFLACVIDWKLFSNAESTVLTYYH